MQRDSLEITRRVIEYSFVIFTHVYYTIDLIPSPSVNLIQLSSMLKGYFVEGLVFRSVFISRTLCENGRDAVK